MSPHELAVTSAASTEKLVALIADGHRPAFDVLHHRVQRQVMATARLLLRDAELAQEVTQEVFVQIWRHASRFDPERGTAAGWIYGLTRSRSIDRIRAVQAARIRDHRWAGGTAILHPPAAEPDSAVLAHMQTISVHAALMTITPRQREAIVLAFFGDHTYPQIAATLKVPLGTVKTRIRDGLRRLRAQLGQEQMPTRHPAAPAAATGAPAPVRDQAA